MAIDSAAKRRSAAGLPFFPLGPGVTPDATQGQAWRQAAGWGYYGILAGVGTAIGSIVGLADRAAYVVALTDSAAYVVALTDSAAYVVELADSLI